MPPGSTTNDDSPHEAAPATAEGPLDGATTSPITTGPNGADGPAQRRGGRRLARWILLAAVLLLAAGVGVFLLVRHRSTPAASTPPGAGAAGPPVSYVLPLVALNQYPVKSGVSSSAGTQAAAGIRLTLSSFYDRAFLTPQTWSAGVSAQAWSLFASDVAAKAKADADSLSLGSSATRIGALSISTASLSVSILFDPSGHATTATALVDLTASGTLKDGGPVQVTTRASFLLKPVGGRWVVVGFPSARTTVDTGSASPTGSPSP